MVKLTPLILSHPTDQKIVSVSKEINKKLLKYQVDAIRFLYRSKRKEFKGAILNYEIGMNVSLVIAGYINALKRVGVHDSPVLIVSSEENLLAWHYYLRKFSGVDIYTLTAHNVDNLLEKDDLFVILTTHKDVSLLQESRDSQFLLVVSDDLDSVVTKRVYKQLKGDFNIGLTTRNFFRNHDTKLMWNLLNWTNPGVFGKAGQFASYDQNYLENLVDPYADVWYRFTWNSCDPDERLSRNSLKEEEEKIRNWAIDANIYTPPETSKRPPRKRKTDNPETSLNQKKTRKRQELRYSTSSEEEEENSMRTQLSLKKSPKSPKYFQPCQVKICSTQSTSPKKKQKEKGNDFEERNSVRQVNLCVRKNFEKEFSEVQNQNKLDLQFKEENQNVINLDFQKAKENDHQKLNNSSKYQREASNANENSFDFVLTSSRKGKRQLDPFRLENNVIPKKSKSEIELIIREEFGEVNKKKSPSTIEVGESSGISREFLDAHKLSSCVEDEDCLEKKAVPKSLLSKFSNLIQNEFEEVSNKNIEPQEISVQKDMVEEFAKWRTLKSGIENEKKKSLENSRVEGRTKRIQETHSDESCDELCVNKPKKRNFPEEFEPKRTSSEESLDLWLGRRKAPRKSKSEIENLIREDFKDIVNDLTINQEKNKDTTKCILENIEKIFYTQKTNEQSKSQRKNMKYKSENFDRKVADETKRKKLTQSKSDTNLCRMEFDEEVIKEFSKEFDLENIKRKNKEQKFQIGNINESDSDSSKFESTSSFFRGLVESWKKSPKEVSDECCKEEIVTKKISNDRKDEQKDEIESSKNNFEDEDSLGIGSLFLSDNSFSGKEDNEKFSLKLSEELIDATSKASLIQTEKDSTIPAEECSQWCTDDEDNIFKSLFSSTKKSQESAHEKKSSESIYQANRRSESSVYFSNVQENNLSKSKMDHEGVVSLYYNTESTESEVFDKKTPEEDNSILLEIINKGKLKSSGEDFSLKLSCSGDESDSELLRNIILYNPKKSPEKKEFSKIFQEDTKKIIEKDNGKASTQKDLKNNNQAVAGVELKKFPRKEEQQNDFCRSVREEFCDSKNECKEVVKKKISKVTDDDLFVESNSLQKISNHLEIESKENFESIRKKIVETFFNNSEEFI